MAWLETDPVKERLNFVRRLEEDDAPSMTELCEAFGVSRKTGYKWAARHRLDEQNGLKARSHARLTQADKTPEEVEELLVLLKAERPRWGPKKLLWLLESVWPEVAAPAPSTVGRILKKHGLVKSCPQRRRKMLRRATPLVEVRAPNDCWSMDFKGDFSLGNGKRCYPLTITDNFSRYLFRCEALKSIASAPTHQTIREVFEEYGLPTRIRTDNGTPFCSNRGLSISALSLWLMRLGITHERIESGHPEQNGRHERMHRTLKEATTLPPARSYAAQQRCFDDFLAEYNQERPHEALSMQTPGMVHVKSSRQYPTHIGPLTYPPAFITKPIYVSGAFCFEGIQYFISEVLYGEAIGLEPLPGDIMRVWAGPLPLGYLDLPKRKFVTYDEDEQLTAQRSKRAEAA